MNNQVSVKVKNNTQKWWQVKRNQLLILGAFIPPIIVGGFLLQGILNNQNSSSLTEPFRLAVNKAMKAAILNKSAQSKDEWQRVASEWKDAIALMKEVSSSAPKYNIAQQKVKEYQVYLAYASINAGMPIVLNDSNTPIKATKEPFRDAVNEALQAAILNRMAKSKEEWKIVVHHWKRAITLMKAVSPSATKYGIAQKKVIQYQGYLKYANTNAGIIETADNSNQSTPASTSSKTSLSTSTEPFRDAVNQAIQAANLNKIAKSKDEWEIVANHWKQAIALMQAVASNSPKYTIAQQKVGEYQTYLDYALEKVSVSPTLMTLKKTIFGKITPKSVVYSGAGLFFAQNMMYSHTITVYDRDYNLVKTIPDSVDLSKYGYPQFKGVYQGAPVEAAFSHSGKYAWISNYQMYGSGFKNPGSDQCNPAGNHDKSFLYRLNTDSLEIEKVIEVGSVPKFVGVSPDNRLVLVSNWCSWDLSVVDTQTNSEIKRVKLGAYPRGIVVNSTSKTAYIAVMGSTDIAKVNLENFEVSWLKNIGSGPRHLNIAPDGKYLYVTLNNEGVIAKIDLETEKVVAKVSTGSAPRSMAISDNGTFVYVVNYSSNTVSKVRTSDMKVIQTVNVNSNPIGITYDPQTKQVWVACYSGSLLVFQE